MAEKEHYYSVAENVYDEADAAVAAKRALSEAASIPPDVAKLIERLRERWESTDKPLVTKINQRIKLCAEAAAALITLSARLVEVERERDEWERRAGDAIMGEAAAVARADLAEAKLAEARKVIAPFAAGPAWSHLDDDAQLTSGAMHGIRITVRHLRAARDWQDAQ